MTMMYLFIKLSCLRFSCVKIIIEPRESSKQKTRPRDCFAINLVSDLFLDSHHHRLSFFFSLMLIFRKTKLFRFWFFFFGEKSNRRKEGLRLSKEIS